MITLSLYSSHIAIGLSAVGDPGCGHETGTEGHGDPLHVPWYLHEFRAVDAVLDFLLPFRDLRLELVLLLK